tara:strand:- start:2978 stop:3217 length:240 start_codon:yes stop_codon:yes gene_type:complete
MFYLFYELKGVNMKNNPNGSHYNWREKPPIGYATKKLNWLLDQQDYWDDNPPNTHEEMRYYVDYKAENIVFNSRIGSHK